MPIKTLAAKRQQQETGSPSVNWLISKEGQAAIASYKIDGQQLFFPNAPRGS